MAEHAKRAFAGIIAFCGLKISGKLMYKATTVHLWLVLLCFCVSLYAAHAVSLPFVPKWLQAQARQVATSS